MRPKVLEETLTNAVLFVWAELGAIYVPMDLVVQMHQETREEYVVSLLMAWLCA